MKPEHFKGREGSRLKENEVKIRETRNGQKHLTIPKKIADTLGWERGTQIKWQYHAFQGIIIQWKKGEEKEYKKREG